MTFKEVYEDWAVAKKRQVKRSTFATYNLMCVTKILPEFGDIDIRAMDRKRIKEWLGNLIDSGDFSKHYVCDMLIVIKMIIKYAEDELELDDIPSCSWKMNWPSSNKYAVAELERYTQAEFKKIVDYCIEYPSNRNLGLVLTITTGMRIGEICALRFDDIDFESKTIHICKTLGRVFECEEGGTKKKTEIIISTPKTVNSDRRVPILKEIYPILKTYNKISRPDYYICTGTQNPTEPRTYSCWYKKTIINDIKLDRALKFHALRHTFASTMIENGIDVKTVSAILGHSDVSITLNIYVHPTDEKKKDAVRKGLNKIFK